MMYVYQHLQNGKQEEIIIVVCIAVISIMYYMLNVCVTDWGPRKW